jgi:hypothetical protein
MVDQQVLDEVLFGKKAEFVSEHKRHPFYYVPKTSNPN